MAEHGNISFTEGPASDSYLDPLMRRYKRACDRRALNDSIIDECYEFALPLRERPYASKEDGKPDLERLFDSTAPTALQDLASQFLDDTWPVDAKPFDLKAGREIPENSREQLDRLLSPIAEDIIETVNNSGFRNEAHESLMDWGIGTGCLLIDEGDALEPIRVRALPLAECYFDTGPYDTIDALFRPRKIRYGDLLILWPDGKFTDDHRRMMNEKPLDNCEIVESACRDWTSKGTEKWKQCVFIPKDRHEIQRTESTGDGSKPFIDFSFTRVPGEIIGRGPVMTALPDIKTLNLTKQFVLENADLHISGIWQAEDDGVLNLDTIRIEPRTIISKAPGSAGLERLDMKSSGFDVSQLIVEELQHSIRKTMFSQDLGPTDKTPMSATEVLERTADRARRLAGPYNRLINELLFQVIRRVAYIRVKQGAFKIPAIDGRVIKIRPLAPITRAQAQDEILRHLRYFEIMLQTVGPQQTQVLANSEKWGRWLAGKQGVEPTLLNTKIETAQINKAIAAMTAMAAAQGEMAA